MRTLVDIPESDLTLLNRLSRSQSVSRAELVREAIASYLKPHRKAEETDAFGLWARDGKPTEDGLAYQQRMREEWPD